MHKIMNRNEKIDFFKGVLMFGVIWGHMITNMLVGAPNNIAVHWIMRTYDMPLFMLISGYFLHFSLAKKDLCNILVDKVTTILVPTLIWDLAISYGRSLGALYFLWAIFLSSVTLSIITKCFRRNDIRILICVLITVLLNFLPWRLCNLSYLFPYFALGYFVNEYKNNLFDNVYVTCVGGYIVLLCFWKIDHTIWSTGTFFKELTAYNIGIVIFRYLIGIVGSIAFISFFNIIYEYFVKHRTKLFDFLVTTGKETLPIYILHIFVICKLMKNIMQMVTEWIGYNPLIVNERLFGYVITPVLSFVVLYITYKIAILTKTNKWTKWLFGFKLSSNK